LAAISSDIACAVWSQQGTANSWKTDISHAPNAKSSGYPSVNDARRNTVWGDESKLLTSKNQVRLVDVLAGQTPTGWDAGRYGIPRDIITQTDRATLWALVCIAEALNTSGITDPYELYKYFHPSDVGTCVGSGMGGTQSLAKMFKDRRKEKDVPNDILQETSVHLFA
jgi:3-oxoacyl-(acyl-carrier-protein) synthase